MSLRIGIWLNVEVIIISIFDNILKIAILKIRIELNLSIISTLLFLFARIDDVILMFFYKILSKLLLERFIDKLLIWNNFYFANEFKRVTVNFRLIFFEAN